MQVGLPNSLSFRALLLHSSDILTTVACGIRSVRLAYKTQKNYKAQLTCLLNVTRVCEPKENICKRSCECGKTLMATAIHWTKTREPRLTATWNSSERSAGL